MLLDQCHTNILSLSTQRTEEQLERFCGDIIYVVSAVLTKDIPKMVYPAIAQGFYLTTHCFIVVRKVLQSRLQGDHGFSRVYSFTLLNVYPGDGLASGAGPGHLQLSQFLSQLQGVFGLCKAYAFGLFKGCPGDGLASGLAANP